jgi:hypothetical protein
MSEVIHTVPCMPMYVFHANSMFAGGKLRSISLPLKRSGRQMTGLLDSCVFFWFSPNTNHRLCVRLGESMYLTGLHLRVPGGAPATYARDMRLFGAFPTVSALPLRAAHVISAISSPGPFLLLARELYAFRPRQPESAVRGVPQPSSQPDARKMCIVQESSDDRKSPSPEVLVAQSGSLA